MVGKKAKVRVERVLDGIAYATLVQAATAKVEAPITAESEAEKPTRAVRKKTTGTNAEALAPAIEKAKEQAAEVAEETVEAVADEEPLAEEPDAEAKPGEAAAPPKKRTQARLTRRPQPAQEAGSSSRSRERRASRGAGAEA